MTSATTSLQPFASFEPPLRPNFDYFVDLDGKPRGVAKMPGRGPTWLTGYVTLPDQQGTNHLVAFYRKIEPPLTVYETGLCVWDDATDSFKHLRTTWNRNATPQIPPPTLVEDGHPIFWSDRSGKRWLMFGNPLPRIKLPATYEAWQDETQWQAVKPQATLRDSDSSAEIVPHSGSIAWNEFRGRWVTVFVQKFGSSSFLGELWYAEADSPTGQWSPAIKVMTHENYTFYNPRLHPELTSGDSPILLFEGSFTAEFAKSPEPTPRYNYNQILYRIDLNDLKDLPQG